MTRAPDPFPVFTRTGTPDDLNAADAKIEETANQLIAALESAGANKRRGLKLEDIKFLAYALVVHRTRRGRVLAEGHLRLLHAVLQIKRVPGGAAEYVGLPDVHNLHAFNAAADLRADDPDLTLRDLGRAVGVNEKTLRKWQTTPLWKARIRFALGLRDDDTLLSGKDRLIKAAYQRARTKLNQAQ